jgi:transposase-like protein
MNTYPCPACSAENRLVKAGRNSSGSQRFKCKVCGSTRVYYPRRRKYGAGWHAQVQELHREGKSFRAIARILKINHQTVANWINNSPASESDPA